MNSSKLTRLFSTAAVVGALATPALAQEEEGIFIPGASAEVTLDYVSQYFFRGYEQLDSDNALNFQPGASFTIDVAEDVTATVGTWGSFNFGEDSRGATNEPNEWYEQDVYGSIDATVGDFSVGFGMTYYTYPSLSGGALQDVVEAALTVGYDDSELFGDLAFAPYVTIATELNNTNSNGADEATYLEVGGEFGIPTEGTAIEAWSWSVPFAVGMSLDDFYNDAGGSEEFFGFASVGLSGSIAMSELIGTDEYFGAWDLSVGVTFLFLNDDVALTDATSSDEFQVYATVGISRSW